MSRFNKRRSRQAKVLVLLVILLPTIFTMTLLIVDGSHLTSHQREAQQIADTAALSAADELYLGTSLGEVETIAQEFVSINQTSATADVEVNCPPLSGVHAGSSQHVEVIVQDTIPNYLGSERIGQPNSTIVARAVAGVKAVTDESAIVVLDDNPPPFALGNILPILPPLPALVGGLEILGLGRVEVDGAVLVNTKWGGVDEFGGPVGDTGPPHAVACMPILPLTKFFASDLRVAGGVDRVKNYAPYGAPASETVLQANRRPVPDPFKNLPVPTVSADSGNVVADFHGGRTIVGIPLIGPPITLRDRKSVV